MWSAYRMKLLHVERFKSHKHWLQEAASWLFVIAVMLVIGGVLIVSHASATTSGKMTLYFHKEASDANETYNSLGFTPPEPAADTTACSATCSTTNVNATPATSFCKSSVSSDSQNAYVADAASVGNRCIGTYISQEIGNAISIGTGDTNAITSQLWSSESATQITTALNVYIYRWNGSGTSVVAGDRIATLTCADPGTSATSCTQTATPANNITFAATDRIVAITSLNVTGSRSNGLVTSYFDSSARTAASITLKYTALAYNTSNKPSLSGSLDDDFTTAAATTACNTSGVAYNSKWTCLQGSAANTAGAFNAEDTAAAGSGDNSSWLWLRNQTTATSATASNFGATPSNTFLYQAMPTSYGDGNIRTVVNSSATFNIASSTATSPFNHVGLVLWTSNTDYLELQVYSTGATTGTNSVVVALNNSGTLGTTTSLNATTTTGIFGEVWLGFSNTSGTWQAQYSTDGTTWNNVGSSVSHTTAFTRVGLNAFTKIANPVSSYAGAFEWFSYGLASPTFNQTSYQWFDNADSTTPGSALNGVAQNTATTLTSSGQAFRLRQLLKSNGVEGANSTSITKQTVDSTSFSGFAPDIKLASDGFPRITEIAGQKLKYIQCLSSNCTTSNINTLDSGINADSTALALASDDTARIAYIDITNNHLKFARCTNASCSTSNIATLDSSTTVTSGHPVSIALGSDGFARMAYQDNTNFHLRYTRCTNADCTTANSTTIDSGINAANTGVSIAIGSDGFPRIAYDDETNFAAKFAQCTNNDCTTLNTNTVGSASTYVSMALGSDGFGRIVYGQQAINSMFYVVCNNASCSSNSPTTITSSAQIVAKVILNSSDLGRIVMGNGATPGVTNLLNCTNSTCSANSVTTLTNSVGVSHISEALQQNGLVMATYANSSNNSELDLESSPLFKLRYAAQGSGCSSATYSDVTSSSVISFKDNPTPADGASITYQSGIDPTDTGQTVVAQSYQESGSFNNQNSFGPASDAEWDFSLFDNGATASTAYCFKITNSDNSDIATYTNYPSITTFGSSGPTMDQVMRGGKWFNASGVKQSYYWAQ